MGGLAFRDSAGLWTTDVQHQVPTQVRDGKGGKLGRRGTGQGPRSLGKLLGGAWPRDGEVKRRGINCTAPCMDDLPICPGEGGSSLEFPRFSCSFPRGRPGGNSIAEMVS